MTRQITEQLRSLIGSGALAVGSLLPSERMLAESLGVARNVVRGSYEYLEKAGVVQRNGNKGRRVRAAPSQRKAASKSSKNWQRNGNAVVVPINLPARKRNALI